VSENWIRSFFFFILIIKNVHVCFPCWNELSADDPLVSMHSFDLLGMHFGWMNKMLQLECLFLPR